jgi:isopenicillin N synthase-like dioxygenase
MINIKYDNLDQDITDKLLDSAFDKNGLGVILVKDVPTLVEKREKLLLAIKKLGTLDKDILQKLERPDIFYNIWWSRGKEKLKGTYDFSKGSFYIESTDIDDDSNVWPTNEVPELKKTFYDVLNLVNSCAMHLVDGIDVYLKSRLVNYKNDMLKMIAKKKSRLLYYYPTDNSINGEEGGVPQIDDWCGWHFDHGVLTALISAMYFKNGKVIDHDSGLTIRDRLGQDHQVTLPKNSIAFQIGEALQILSGGHFIATPHCVTPSADKSVTRCTMAVFMDCPYDTVLRIPEGNEEKDMLYDPGIETISPLKSRWKNGISYKKLEANTFSAFY